MNVKPHVRIEHVSRIAAFISGSGARPAIYAIRKKPPVWSTTRKAFAVQAATAHDVEAYAERRGWSIVVEHHDQEGLFW